MYLQQIDHKTNLTNTPVFQSVKWIGYITPLLLPMGNHQAIKEKLTMKFHPIGAAAFCKH